MRLLLLHASLLVGLACSSNLAPTERPPLDAGRDASPADVGSDRAAADGPDAAAPCRDGAAPPWPSNAISIAEGGPLPDLRFPTADGEVSLGRFYAPCDASPRLLVVRSLAAWSGPSRWHAAHTARRHAQVPANWVTVLDLLVLGADNLPATPSDLAAWRAAYDVPSEVAAIDPGYRFQSLYFAAGQLPIVLLVDPRTMRPLRVLTMPASNELEFSVALAQLDGRPRSARPT